ncbi:hypothetical protein DES34_10734 [Brevibacillus brevis]|nr:hypothetical protein DES34_10734 [Brevibacillus brevis]VEF91720.1 Uncharacterised protein [Brevibacillus brevis]
MQKAKHVLKRPPLKHILKGQLWTRFRFLHGVVQRVPQGVALEAERFLLFPPVSSPPQQQRTSRFFNRHLSKRNVKGLA